MEPTAPITRLKGVGPSLAGKLGNLGIARIGDLLLHLPMRYQDRSRLVPMSALNDIDECLIEGRVLNSKITYGKRRSWLVTIEDDTGFVTLRFFYFSRQQQAGLHNGMTVRAFGSPRPGPAGMEMVHPEYQASSGALPPPTAQLTPLYHTTKGIGQGQLRRLLTTALALDFSVASAGDWPLDTLRYLHNPPATASLADITAAAQRIAMDELTAYYLVMQHRQSERKAHLTLALPQKAQLGRTLLRNLGFQLTGAQRRATTEVLDDLSVAVPMLRLVQGDVGSGKTVVAAFAAIRAAEHGAQTALMAPTEILAEQHFVNFTNWLQPLGIEVVLLTGSLNAAQRRTATDAIKDGSASVAVGTHALFQKGVDFHDLALTIVDEQHRFGVHQRMALRNKGRIPHQLILTATPIPRTLTMALYADMDVSLIDELPAGRQPIDTVIMSDERRADILQRVRGVLDAGQQAYWVCTLIEPSEVSDAAAAEPTYEHIAQALRGYRVGLLHGRMPAADKARTMDDFKSGKLQLLVATTVIEVGVDAPNATLIVIEDANRLGLSQLHQLRGRVGRGEAASHCVLLYKTPLGAIARERLQTIRDSSDGFHIAERDLELRGPGEILGARQTGIQQFRIADLARDAVLIPEVLARGQRLLREDPATAQRLLRTWAPADTGSISV